MPIDEGTLQLCITTDDRWTLEVVDHEDGSTVWDGDFATDVDAFEAFEQCVQKEGIRAFAEGALKQH